MKGFSVITVGAAALLASCVEGIELRKREDGRTPSVVELPIQRNQIRDPLLRDKIRRRKTQAVTLDNLETLYFANGSIGTPAQAQRWHLDTGSSDLWVNTPASSLCSDGNKPCAFAGSYKANSSSTYEYISSDFNITYVDGSGATGDYVSDTFTIGRTKLSRLQFGIGYSSSSIEGVLGIGYPSNEIQVTRMGKAAYSNLPFQMVSEGLTSAKAYSIWLNDLDASTGSILFGGVDSARYQGTLETLPIQTRTAGSYSEFLITLTGVSYRNKSLSSPLAQAVLLDTGCSLTYLPNSLAQSIFTAVGAVYSGEAGAAYIPCSARKDTTSLLTFSFSGASINVDMSELVIAVANPNTGKPYTFRDGTEACIFGITMADGSTSVLGDTFLRSAYVVYDLGRNEISLAQTRFNATGSNVLEIAVSGDSGVPGAKTIANAATATTGLRGGIGRIGGTATLETTTPSVTSTNGASGFVVTKYLAWCIGIVMAMICLIW